MADCVSTRADPATASAHIQSVICTARTAPGRQDEEGPWADEGPARADEAAGKELRDGTDERSCSFSCEEG